MNCGSVCNKFCLVPDWLSSEQYKLIEYISLLNLIFIISHIVVFSTDTSLHIAVKDMNMLSWLETKQKQWQALTKSWLILCIRNRTLLPANCIVIFTVRWNVSVYHNFHWSPLTRKGLYPTIHRRQVWYVTALQGASNLNRNVKIYCFLVFHKV